MGKSKVRQPSPNPRMNTAYRMRNMQVQLHHQELKQLTHFFSEVPGKQRTWVHIKGEEGCGKSSFINSFLHQEGRFTENSPERPLIDAGDSKKQRPYFLLYQFDFKYFPLKTSFQIKSVIRHIFQIHYTHFKKYLQQYSTRFQKQIIHFLKQTRPLEDITTLKESWEYHLFSPFTEYLSNRYKPLFVFKGISDNWNTHIETFLKVLNKVDDSSLTVISSGCREILSSLDNFHLQEIHLRKISVRETEQLIADYLGTDTIITRLISNQLYIKSAGIAQKIKFMLEGFYRPLLKELPESFTDGNNMQRIPVSASVEDIFKSVFQQFSEKEGDIFAFLCRLEDPCPEKLLLDIMKIYGLDKTELQYWQNQELLKKENYLQEQYILIHWQAWKDFLRKNTSVERTTKLLQFIKHNIPQYQASLPLELSNQYCEIGEMDWALKLAYQEANYFMITEEFQRALNRYAFLHRNLHRYFKADIQPEQVFREMGELQKKVGLYANAYEAFRELSKILSEENQAECGYATLQMAEALFQMDALSEARSLIQELQKKNLKIPDLEVSMNILMGELEENSGHYQKALEYYEAAKSLFQDINDQSLMPRLYSILKRIYLKKDQNQHYVDLVRKMILKLNGQSIFKLLLQLDLIKYFINQNNYQEALPLLISLYRQPHRLLTPTISSQICLYLSEAYGYYGKWHLSRSHLQRMVKICWLIPNLRVRFTVMMNLGIVEKEIGHYGKAFNYLREALWLAQNSQHLSQVYIAKIHLGHLYLLTHNFIRGREHLIETLQWAEENQESGLALTSALFLSSYELHRNRLSSARQYLVKAKENISRQDAPIDQLNYFYYQAQYELCEGNIEKVAAIVEIWQKRSKGIVKFESLSLWFSGKSCIEKNLFVEAQTRLEEALQRSIQYRLPYLEFQVLRDLIKLAKKQNNNDAVQYYSLMAHQASKKFLELVGDEILQRQIQESKEYDEFLRLDIDMV